VAATPWPSRDHRLTRQPIRSRRELHNGNCHAAARRRARTLVAAFRRGRLARRQRPVDRTVTDGSATRTHLAEPLGSRHELHALESRAVARGTTFESTPQPGRRARAKACRTARTGNRSRARARLRDAFSYESVMQ